MARARLYVRSKRTTIITGHVSMETIGTSHTTQEYSEGSSLNKLSREDEYARNLLKRAGVDFEVVDLSKGMGQRLRARLKGVKLTPVMVDENSPERKFAGLSAISRFVAERKNPTHY